MVIRKIDVSRALDFSSLRALSLLNLLYSGPFLP
jgi:hypothetical protein